MLKKGFTLIEIILVLTVMSLLAASVTPNFLKKMEQDTIEVESANLKGIVDSLKTYSHNNRIIPGAATWATAIGTITNLPPSKILTNTQGFSRIFVFPDNFIAPADSLPYNQASRVAADTIPTTAPVNPKYMIITNIKKDITATSGITSGAMASATFDNIWNQTGTFPPELTESRDVLIERGSVSDLFSNVVLNNNEAVSPEYNIDGSLNKVMPAGPITQSFYLLKGSLLGLFDAIPALLNKHVVRDNVSYSYASNTWGGILGATGTSAASSGSIASVFGGTNGALSAWSTDPACVSTGSFDLIVDNQNGTDDVYVWTDINAAGVKVKKGKTSNPIPVIACNMVIITPKANGGVFPTAMRLFYMPNAPLTITY